MNCSDDVLKSLLTDDAEADADDVITQHVGTCTRCQQRISELAADSESWHEATSALQSEVPQSSIVIALDEELTEEAPVQADHLSLDFLDAPSHPEMLGRLGDYEIERVIGSGGMGIVFKAFDSELHRPVAVKVLAPHLAHSGGARQRFAREAQSAAAVVHENVVPIHNVNTTGKFPFIVMQFVGGHSLQARVDRDGSLGTTEVLRIGMQIANGLAAAHAQGLVHRDVKPGNILLGEGVDRVLISDFGLARAADDASVTRSGLIAGTPHYMSPEQAHGDPIDGRSDLFALGSVLYFMCTGRPPFRADGTIAVLNRICHDTHRPVDDINEQVPANLANLIDELLEKDANTRPQTAAEVATRLAAILQDSRQGRNLSRRRLTKSKSTVLRWTLAGLFVSAALILAGLFRVFGPGPSATPSTPTTSTDMTAGTIRESVPLNKNQNDVIAGIPTRSNAALGNSSQSPEVVNELRTPILAIFPVDGFDDAASQLEADIRDMEFVTPDEFNFDFSNDDNWQKSLDETNALLDRFEH